MLKTTNYGVCSICWRYCKIPFTGKYKFLDKFNFSGIKIYITPESVASNLLGKSIYECIILLKSATRKINFN